jgi:integrase
MRGHVRKRGTKWSFVVDVTTEGPVPRQRKQKWHSGYATKKDAEDALTEVLGKMHAGTYVETARQTVAEYLREWLDAIGGTIRPGTLRSYRTNMEVHVITRIGGVPLAKVTPVRLNSLYAELLVSGRHDGNGGLSTRTVRYTHTILHRAFRDAVRWGLLHRNPSDFADPPRHIKPEMRVWTTDELRAFLAFVAGDELHALWVLLATSGMRRGEALGLRWQDVDLRKGRLSVRQSLSSGGGKLSFSPPKTARSRRSLSLDPGTVAVLRTHRAQQGEDQLAEGVVGGAGGLVFARSDGSPTRPDSVSRRFTQLSRGAGVPVIRVHDLRHTYATIALSAGAHPKVVAERLGHSTIAITLDTYSHVLPALEEETANRLAQLILGPATAG